MTTTVTRRVARLDALHRLAAGQLGLVTGPQARAEGWTKQQLHRATTGGRIEPLHPGVWRVPGSPATWEQRLLAAVLAAGPGAVASHRSGLALHEIPPGRRDSSVRPHVSVAPHRHPVVSGATVHRVWLPAHHLTEVDGIPVTTFARTLVDNAARLGVGQLARALDLGLVSGAVTLDSVRAVIDDLAPAPGRRRARLLALVDERAPGSDLTQSEAEIRVLTAIHRAGFPPPIPQYPVTIDGETFYLDGAYPGFLLGLEYHGWDVHRTRSAFDADFRRDRLLTVAGWDVVYFTRASTDREIAETLHRLGVRRLAA
jgi:hypothetical protein